MSVMDLHVESLLDRERVSILTEAEQHALDEHLDSCVECRFERQVRRDFAQSLRGPVGVDDVDDLIDRVLGEGAAAPVNISIAVAPRPALRPPLRLGRGVRRWLTVGGVLLGSTAAAAFVSEPLLSHFWPPAANPAASERAESNSANAGNGAGTTPSTAVVWEPMALYAPSSEVLLPSAANAQARPNHEPAAVTGDHSGAPLESAALIFSRANELRHAGKLGAALKGYSALDTKYPQSAEARLSKSIVARLLLDHNQATQALQSYDDILRANPNGLEALMGRAQALRRLGQRAAEARTLRQVIQGHPNSVHADAARTRLSELQ